MLFNVPQVTRLKATSPLTAANVASSIHRVVSFTRKLNRRSVTQALPTQSPMVAELRKSDRKKRTDGNHTTAVGIERKEAMGIDITGEILLLLRDSDTRSNPDI